MVPATLDILIANEPGKSVYVPYKIDEPVSSLLDRISRQLGHNTSTSNETSNIKDDATPKETIQARDLYVGGTRIWDVEQSIEYYRILGNVFTYKHQKADEIAIVVKTLDGSQVIIPCKPVNSIEDIYGKIEKLDPQTVIDQRQLIQDGKHLAGQQSLQFYNITNGSTLHLVLRLRGGGGGMAAPGVMFADVSDTSGGSRMEFSNAAPPGRVASAGTNIECDCECTPDYYVICERRFGITEPHFVNFRCPNCYQYDRIVPVTVGFVSCKYRFHGIKAETNEQFSSEWKVIGGRMGMRGSVQENRFPGSVW